MREKKGETERGRGTVKENGGETERGKGSRED